MNITISQASVDVTKELKLGTDTGIKLTNRAQHWYDNYIIAEQPRLLCDNNPIEHLLGDNPTSHTTLMRLAYFNHVIRHTEKLEDDPKDYVLDANTMRLSIKMIDDFCIGEKKPRVDKNGDMIWPIPIPLDNEI